LDHLGGRLHRRRRRLQVEQPRLHHAELSDERVPLGAEQIPLLLGGRDAELIVDVLELTLDEVDALLDRAGRDLVLVQGLLRAEVDVGVGEPVGDLRGHAGRRAPVVDHEHLGIADHLHAEVAQQHVDREGRRGVLLNRTGDGLRHDELALRVEVERLR
jgi:hypothetical protein